jgi:hypothetical protein
MNISSRVLQLILLPLITQRQPEPNPDVNYWLNQSNQYIHNPDHDALDPSWDINIELSSRRS